LHFTCEPFQIMY